jgi:hypothetical protein
MYGFAGKKDCLRPAQARQRARRVGVFRPPAVPAAGPEAGQGHARSQADQPQQPGRMARLAGDQAAATAAAFRQVLGDHVRILGPDHPETLETRQDLAELRAKSGDVTGAIADFRKLLADQRRLPQPAIPRSWAPARPSATARPVICCPAYRLVVTMRAEEQRRSAGAGRECPSGPILRRTGRR